MSRFFSRQFVNSLKLTSRSRSPSVLYFHALLAQRMIHITSPNRKFNYRLNDKDTFIKWADINTAKATQEQIDYAYNNRFTESDIDYLLNLGAEENQLSDLYLVFLNYHQLNKQDDGYGMRPMTRRELLELSFRSTPQYKLFLEMNQLFQTYNIPFEAMSTMPAEDIGYFSYVLDGHNLEKSTLILEGYDEKQAKEIQSQAAKILIQQYQSNGNKIIITGFPSDHKDKLLAIFRKKSNKYSLYRSLIKEKFYSEIRNKVSLELALEAKEILQLTPALPNDFLESLREINPISTAFWELLSHRSHQELKELQLKNPETYRAKIAAEKGKKMQSEQNQKKYMRTSSLTPR